MAAWAVVGAVACGDGAAAPIGPATAAVASRACGPADEPGVGIVLAPTRAAAEARRPPYVLVTVWRRSEPDTLVGRTWVLDGRSGFAVQQLTPTRSEEATRATLTVLRAAADTAVEGTVDLAFPSGTRVRQAFRATWRPGLVLCG